MDLVRKGEGALAHPIKPCIVLVVEITLLDISASRGMNQNLRVVGRTIHKGGDSLLSLACAPNGLSTRVFFHSKTRDLRGCALQFRHPLLIQHSVTHLKEHLSSQNGANWTSRTT